MAEILGALVGSAIFFTICRSMLAGFSEIEVEGEMLRLSSALPPRLTIIRRDELARFEKVHAHGVAWRLVIVTTKGERAVSVVASEPVIEGARLRLAQLAAE